MKTGKQILDEVLRHTGLNHNSLAIEIGLKRSQNLYDIENKKVKKISSELADKIISRFPEFNKSYLLIGQPPMLLDDTPYSDLTNNSMADNTNQGSAPISRDHSDKAANDPESKATIQSLADSNKRLADAQIAVAEGNKTLINANAELVMLLKSALGRANLDELKQTQIEDHTRISVLEKYVAAIGVGVKIFQSLDDADGKINKALNDALQAQKLTGTRDAVDTSNKK